MQQSPYAHSQPHNQPNAPLKRLQILPIKQEMKSAKEPNRFNQVTALQKDQDCQRNLKFPNNHSPVKESNNLVRQFLQIRTPRTPDH